MSKAKDEIVNKAMELTRRYRPINIDRKGNLIDPPASWQNVNHFDRETLIELCWSIQDFIYGEKNNNES